jgi:hypothetical protein
MMTVGGVIVGACGTYRALSIISGALDEAGHVIPEKVEAARSLAEDVINMNKKYGPLGPIVLGRSDQDEKDWLRRQIESGRKKVGI